MNPLLVLLPGMDGTGELFAPLVDALGSSLRTRIVRYPDRVLDYPAHESLVRAHLPAAEPFVLLGESFSGPIAVSIAASAPPNLEAIILCCSFVRSPRLLLRWFRPLLGLLPPQRIPSVLADYFLMGRFGSATLGALHARTLCQVSPATLTGRLRAIAAVDVRSALARVRVPVLYLRAIEDRIVPRAAAGFVVRGTAEASVVDIEGPHFLLQARPEASARAILQFVRTLA